MREISVRMLHDTKKAVAMTKQESFKRRIRERMAKTGERYTTARRALLAKSKPAGRAWVAPPEVTDQAVIEATGASWDQWCDLIDAWSGSADGHAAVAQHLAAEHDLDPWWSQTVTVGWERITGVRLPYQRADGTFSAGKSATIPGDPAMLRRMLLSDSDRKELFPGHQTELLSAPDAKAIRISLGPGVAVMSIEPKSNGRMRVAIQHNKLPTFERVEEWKFYWTDWLDAVGAL